MSILKLTRYSYGVLGPGGEKVSADIFVNGNALIIDPKDGLEQDVPIDGIIVVNFDTPLLEKQTSIQLSDGGTTVKLPAVVQGTTLTAPYSHLLYNTEYTVAIPQGTVESQEHGTQNDKISWSFTTQKMSQ